MSEKWWLLVSDVLCCKIELTSKLTGITISGLEGPLTVGQQPPTLTCRTNILVSSIVWRNQSSNVVANATNQTVLEYQFPERYMLDTYHGQQYTCEAVAISDDGTNTTYTETVEIQVVGRY